MKPGLQLRVSQHLALTPQLQQSIRLLQLSTLELSQEIEHMLEENPFLEVAEEESEPTEEPTSGSDMPTSASLAHDASTDAAASEQETEAQSEVTDDWTPDRFEGDAVEEGYDWGSEAPANRQSASDDEGSALDWMHEPESLPQYLHRQALGLRLSAEVSAALFYLIESLDDDGFLSDSLEELAHALCLTTPDDLAATQAALEEALEHLQAMDPLGVGARTLQECLQIQVADMRNTPLTQAAWSILMHPMEWVAKREWKRLQAATELSEERVREAVQLIQRLEPKPGRRFAQAERNIVVPDVLVTAARRGFHVALNPQVVPRLAIHDVYAQTIKSGKGQAHQHMQQRLQEARWFVRNVQQRFDTILRVATAIVERQKAFFEQGPTAMKPLVLREIADALGLHESTISRVTTSKFMATPQGTFELKYFFSPGLSTDAGDAASSTAVRALIRQLIADENPAKPLSDNTLSDMLKQKGIDCARRTVAKYRESMRIASANLRKTV